MFLYHTINQIAFSKYLLNNSITLPAFLYSFLLKIKYNYKLYYKMNTIQYDLNNDLVIFFRKPKPDNTNIINFKLDLQTLLNYGTKINNYNKIIILFTDIQYNSDTKFNLSLVFNQNTVKKTISEREKYFINNNIMNKEICGKKNLYCINLDNEFNDMLCNCIENFSETNDNKNKNFSFTYDDNDLILTYNSNEIDNLKINLNDYIKSNKNNKQFNDFKNIGLIINNPNNDIKDNVSINICSNDYCNQIKEGFSVIFSASSNNTLWYLLLIILLNYFFKKK